MTFNRNSFQQLSSQLQYFEYFLLKCIEWSYVVKGTYDNDISVLKSQKLLFFAVAADSKKASGATFLGASVFNRFKAYQYGPVEELVYEDLKARQNRLSHVVLSFKNVFLNEGELSIAIITDLCSSIKNSGLLDSKMLDAIDQAVESLKRKSQALIKYEPFALVTLSHNWRCWSVNYAKGNRTAIPFEEIQSESMTLSL